MDENLDWRSISIFQHLSEDDIRKYKDYVCWNLIVKFQLHISEKFIIEFKDRIDWKTVTYFRKFSEDFLRQLKNEDLNWNKISQHQVLSEEFIEEFADKLDWYKIIHFQKQISEDFKNRNKFRIRDV